MTEMRRYILETVQFRAHPTGGIGTGTSGSYRNPGPRPTVAAMTKRILGGVLWAIAIQTGWQLATGVLGLGDLWAIGLIISVAAGAVIAIDPRQVVWSPADRRRVLDPADYETSASGIPASRPHS